MSSIPSSKEELLLAIKKAEDKLTATYLSIPEEYSRKLGIEGNSKQSVISVSDTLAYLIGWGRLVLKWCDKRSLGQVVDFPETGYKWNELGRLAQNFYSQYQDWDYMDLINEFELITSEIVLFIDSQTDARLYGENWYKKYTLGRMIQLNTSSPMKNMYTKVRRFKKDNNL